MKQFQKYILILIVAAASFLGAIFIFEEDFFKGVISFPGVAALVYALYEIIRDESQHAKQLFLQNKQQDFILSSSSHVAKVAYDKHVLFCEEYVSKVQEGISMLRKEGTSPEALNVGANLVRIRQKHSVWLTEDIENKLKPFEQALIEIGANETYLRRTATNEIDERQREIIEKLYRSFGLVLGHEKPKNNEESELHIDKVIDKIRDILGIKEMTELRIKATSVALNRLNNL